jgi:tRNA (cytidine/uridine-2'-O-)-methyltransferase
VRPLGFDISEKAVRRAGLDYWKYVDLEVHDHFDSVLAALPHHRFTFTSSRRGEIYAHHRFEPGEVLVFGRESVGLPEHFHAAYADQFIRIPDNGMIRSLNLSCAASVIVYEGLRQLSPSWFPGGQ